MSIDDRLRRNPGAVAAPANRQVDLDERRPRAEWAKRTLDVLLATAALVVLSPLYALVALAIMGESGRPILFRPTVRGRGGRRFLLLKFRSMAVDAREVLDAHPELRAEYERNLKIRHDPRVTRVGRVLRKLSLDELPQFVNVLRGEMSVVGPRVLSDIEYARYGEAGPRVLSVLPGVTGLWQVSGRHLVSFERRLELDLEYIERRSFWLDLQIILRTIPAVISGRGAE